MLLRLASNLFALLFINYFYSILIILKRNAYKFNTFIRISIVVLSKISKTMAPYPMARL